MKIALLADPMLPVPPKHYGGIERIIDMLARELERRGHEVTLFAHRDSDSAGDLVPWHSERNDPLATMRNAATLSTHAARGRFDVVHSFARVATLAPILPLSVPKLMTYQRAISPRTVRWGNRISRGTLDFCAISAWMYRHVAHLARWHMVPNGVPLATYTFQGEVGEDAPLVFLGRVEEIKGPHLAIGLAQRTGRNLVIAGNIPDGGQDWFDRHVAPHVDGAQIRFIGPVDDAQKNALLRNAYAFLMPILWEEPFGIVMAEAMACGTPVVGLARGAVPEVVDDGVTGFVRDREDQLDAAIAAVASLSRRACRDRVERLYSESAIADGYLHIYSAMMARADEAA